MPNIDYTALINGEENVVEEMPAALSMTRATPASESENWTYITGYEYYREFSDEDVSVINKQKTITLNENQANLTQEKFSQFIPFEIDRYQDGLDLRNATIQINYKRPNEEEVFTSIAVNAKFNESKIRFGWLIDDHVTEKEGTVQFEIEITGTVSSTKNGSSQYRNYTWKSRTNQQLQVIKSLGTGVTVEITDDWKASLVELIRIQLTDKIASEEFTSNYYTKSQVEDYVAGELAQVEKPDLNPYVVNGDLSIDSNDYKLTLTLYTGYGNKTSTIDLPLETIVVGGSYDNEAKKIILTLKNGNEVEIPVGDIVNGLTTAEELSAAVEAITQTISDTIANYYTKEEIDGQIESINNTAAALGSRVEAVENKFGTLVDKYGEEVTVQEYVDSIDISDRLGDLGVKSDPETGELVKCTVVDYTNARLGELKNAEGAEVTVKEYVESAVESIDISDRLGNLGEDEEGKPLTVEAFVEKQIEEADISEQLSNYYNKQEIEEKLENVSVDLSGYYTKPQVDEKIGELLDEDFNELSVKEYVDSKIGQDSVHNYYKATYGTTEINGEEKDYVFTLWRANKEFDPMQPGDANPVIDSQFIIAGGGGSGEQLGALYIRYDTIGDKLLQSYIYRQEDVARKEAVINYSFNGTDASGNPIFDGVDAVWQYRQGTTSAWQVIKTEQIAAPEEGEKLTFNVSEYLKSDTSYQFKVTLSHESSGASVSGQWTVRRTDFRIDTTFDDKKKLPIQDVEFSYTPYGTGIEKTIHFIWDGNELESVITSATKPTTQILPVSIIHEFQRHGAHRLEVFMTAKVNGIDLESNHIYKDIILYNPNSTIPVIGCAPNAFTIQQYSAIGVEYVVFDPVTETPTVTIQIDDEEPYEKTLTEGPVDNIRFKGNEPGVHKIVITRNNGVSTQVAKTTITIDVSKLPYTIAPVPGAIIDFDPVGHSNSDRVLVNPKDPSKGWNIWTNGTYSLIASENFDWVNGGYKTEFDTKGALIEGSDHLRIKAGTYVDLDYKFFGGEENKGSGQSNPKTNGKDFKIIFKTDNVERADAKFLSCMPAKDEANIGMEMFVYQGRIHAQGGTLTLPYAEKEIIEYGFKIAAESSKTPVVMGYEDGVTTSAMVYNDGYSFVQPKEDRAIIRLGSEYCDLYIYKLKIYEKELSDENLLNNFIADARTGEELVARYERNQITMTPEELSKQFPDLRVITISAPHFTDGKNSPVNNTTIEYRHEGAGPDEIKYWKCTDAVHVGQGTSSDLYGAAGRNIDLVMKTHKTFNNNPVITLGDGTIVKNVPLSATSVPNNYFNIKVNIASSENANNALLQKHFNENHIYKRPIVRYTKNAQGETVRDTELEAKVKDTMEFFNCVVFIQEGGPNGEYGDIHREFADNEIHFYAIGNIGDSKKTDKTRLTDQSDDYECCLEIGDVRLPLSDFPVDTIVNAMRQDDKGKYLFATNDNLDKLYELIDGKYVKTQDTEVDVENKVYYIDGKEVEDFSGDYTYEWRYIKEYDKKDFKTDENTDDEAEVLANARNEEIFNYCASKWWELYDFVTKSSDEDFYKYLGEFFVLDSAFYYYLFTERYTMVDNRAKNSFWHYSKTGEKYAKDIEYRDINGNIIFSARAGEDVRKWDLNWGYDMDTALGTDNDGDIVYDYGMEDVDFDDRGIEVFRESDSTFFCRLRDRFSKELAERYQSTALKGVWDSEKLITRFNNWQSQFPEELWRLDIERKYVRTYTSSFIGGRGDAKYLDNMANGKKKYQRAQFERSQDRYMSSKYDTSVATSNYVTLRCADVSKELLAVPTNYSLNITPYARMYLSATIGNQKQKVRATELVNEDGTSKSYELKYTENKAPDFININSAYWLQSIGDLSPLYVSSISAAGAEKLKELIIGSQQTRDFGDGNILTYSNPHLDTLTPGACKLLEVMNIENVGYTKSLDVSELESLREFYGKGSSILGFVGANGGELETVELPAITSLKLQNLSLLENFSIESLANLTTLTIENCPTVDWISIVTDAPKLRNFRMTGVDWNLPDTSLLERIYNMSDPDGVGNSQLTGKVHVPVIKTSELAKYRSRWKDLEITYNTEREEFIVKYFNPDGSEWKELETAVAVGDVVPVPDFIPTQEATEQYVYEFAYWKIKDTDIRYDFTSPLGDNLYLEAVYNAITRTYTIVYESKGVVLQTNENVKYGEYIDYLGETPTYTTEEISNRFYLFSGWDKSGYVNGDKVISAQYSVFQYSTNFFKEHTLSELTPVQMYALTRLRAKNLVNIDDLNYQDETYVLNFGNDFSFDQNDISSEVIVAEPKTFNGKNERFDSNIKLFDIDKDFVIACDFQFDKANIDGATLIHCYNGNLSSGFRVGIKKSGSYSQVILYWGASAQVTLLEKHSDDESLTREMLVLRHKRGETGIHVYFSHKAKEEQSYFEMSALQLPKHEITFVLGCQKDSTGLYSDYASGTVYWSKIWNGDIGDVNCKLLATWPHEQLTFTTCETADKRVSASLTTEGSTAFVFLAQNLLDTKLQSRNLKGDTSGGWEANRIKPYLDNRVFNAVSEQQKALIKEIKIPTLYWENNISEINKTEQVARFFIPSLGEVDNQGGDRYGAESLGLLKEMTSSSARVCATMDGVRRQYWLRTPNVSFQTGMCSIEDDGDTYLYSTSEHYYLRLMFGI